MGLSLSTVSAATPVILQGTFREVLFIENREISGVYLYLVFPTGEADNPFEEGLAHYVEHLAWLSAFSETTTDDTDQGHSNAWTNLLSTGYWLQAKVEDLRTAFEELVLVASPIALEEKFALEERSIVLREYDARIAEQPLYPIYRGIETRLYDESALARSVVGDPRQIRSFSLSDAKELHANSHRISEATLFVYGDADRAEIEAMLQSIETSARAASVDVTRKHLPNVLVPLRDVADTHVTGLADDVLIYRKLVPLSACNDFVACQTAIDIVERALDSTLPEGIAGPIRYDNFLARSFSLDIYMVEDRYAEISFLAHPDIGISLDELQTAFEAALNMTLINGISQETLERIRDRMSGRLDGIIDHQSYNRDLIFRSLMAGRPIYSLVDEKYTLHGIERGAINALLQDLSASGRVVIRRAYSEG